MNLPLIDNISDTGGYAKNFEPSENNSRLFSISHEPTIVAISSVNGDIEWEK